MGQLEDVFRKEAGSESEPFRQLSAAISLKRIAEALEKQNELMAQANKIGERNVAAAERFELANHEPPWNENGY